MANIPEFLASKIESIQKRAMHIIFATCSCDEALSGLSLTTLNERRVHLCQVYIARLQRESHPLHFILPKLLHEPPCQLGTCRTDKSVPSSTGKMKGGGWDGGKRMIQRLNKESARQENVVLSTLR